MRLSKKLLLFGIFVAIAMINIRVGKVIMGFDNSSPFFSASATLFRVFSTDNFFHYGGMLFSPALLFSILGIPAWLNSHLTYLGAMVIGMFFSSLIALEISTQVKKEDRNWMKNVLLVSLIVLGNLVVIWAFSLPILIFAPSFAGIATLLFVLTKNTENRLQTEGPLIIILLFFGFLYFYSTSINIAAFALYFIESISLAVLFKRSSTTYESIVKKASVVALIYILLVQTILILRPSPHFIVTEAINYGNAIAADAKSGEVTTSLFRMETQRNSIINVARFATGWVALTDGNQQYISRYKGFIDSLFGILVTLTPVALIIYYLITHRNELTRKEKQMAMVWITAILLSTSYALIFTRMIPYLGVILRWISSKLWPLIFFPYVVLLLKALNSHKVRSVAKLSTVLALVAMTIPWIIGIVNKYQQVVVPPSYQEVFQQFKSDQTVLYLPAPQRLYMRQYSWGYYGSGFLTYLTKAKILDNGSFHPEQNIYLSLVTAFENCDLLKLRKHTTVIIVDNSTILGNIPIPICYDSINRQKNGELTIMKL